MDDEYGDGGFDDFGDGEPMDVEAEVCSMRPVHCILSARSIHTTVHIAKRVNVALVGVCL